MGAIDRGEYRFQPEFSVINQNGAIHVYHKGEFVEELKFEFKGSFPEHDQIEEMVDDYCDKRDI